MLEQSRQSATETSLDSPCPGKQAIASALEPILEVIKRRVFEDIAKEVETKCSGGRLDFKEAWIGISDVSLTHGISVSVVLCHPETRYNEQRQDAASELGISLSAMFPDITYMDVCLGHHPYVQQEHSPPLARILHEDLWKQVFDHS